MLRADLRGGDRGNSALYSNPAVDKLLDAANTELDPAKRAGGDKSRKPW